MTRPRSRLGLLVRCLPLAAGLVLGGMPEAFAQTEDAITIERLREELARRDAIIIDLVNRVEALEARQEPGSGTAARVQQDAPPAAIETPPAGEAPAANIAGEEAPPGGDFTVDALAAERALERSLVQEGAFLLNPGQMELTPEFSFARTEDGFPTLFTSGAGTAIAQSERSRNFFDFTVGLRAGLPFDSQLEIAVPYRWVTQRTAVAVAGATTLESEASGSGLGDVELGLAKTLLHRNAWRPDLVGRVTWITGSGEESDDGVSLGGGTSALAGQLNAVWRRDPVVFLASAGYTTFFGSAHPGDAAGLSLGTAIALSPETALTFSFDQSYAGKFAFNGVGQRGTETLSSTFNVSASTILGPRLFFRVTAGIGLTEDAPDYRLVFSLPLRFTAPGIP
jgi:hypothetical protein